MYTLTLKELIRHTKSVSSPFDPNIEYDIFSEGGTVSFLGNSGDYKAQSDQVVLVRSDTDIVHIRDSKRRVLRFIIELFGGSTSKAELLEEFRLTNTAACISMDLVQLIRDYKIMACERTSELVKSINVINTKDSLVPLRSPTLALTLQHEVSKEERVVHFKMTSPFYDFYPIYREVTLISDQEEGFVFHFSDPVGVNVKVNDRKVIRIAGNGFAGSPIGDFYPTPFQEMMYADLVRKFVDPNKVFYMLGPGSPDIADMVQIQMVNYQNVSVLKMGSVDKEIKSVHFTDRSQAIWFYIKSLFEMVE